MQAQMMVGAPIRETSFQIYRYGMYFRIRGYGASLVHDMPVMFSERVGRRRVYRAFDFAFQWLKP